MKPSGPTKKDSKNPKNTTTNPTIKPTSSKINTPKK